MENTTKLIEETEQYLRTFSRDWPQQMTAFTGLAQVVESPGALSPKVKELIAIALSVYAHCSWCIAYHVKSALGHGATKEEVMEAAWVAVLMGGGPSLMYIQLVQKSLDDLSRKPE